MQEVFICFVTGFFLFLSFLDLDLFYVSPSNFGIMHGDLFLFTDA